MVVDRFVKGVKRAWRFLWYDDSLTSWLVLMVLAVLFIKFIFYPVIGALLGTQFPIVAVVSSSMEHHPPGFDDWWGVSQDCYLKYNITKEEFESFPFKNGFDKGDIMILRGVNTSSLKTGEVIVYWADIPYPIIHRYIGRNPSDDRYLMSKGDNNGIINSCFIKEPGFDEQRISPDRVIGRAWLRIPYIGYVKIWFTELVNYLKGY